MRIKKGIYNYILNQAADIYAESGGLLFSRENVICEYIPLENISLSFGSYSFDIAKANSIIENKTAENFHFAGIVHSHLNDSNCLSHEDKISIRKIVEATNIRKLYFPLVYPKRNDIIFFCSYKMAKFVIIKRVKVVKVVS